MNGPRFSKQENTLDGWLGGWLIGWFGFNGPLIQTFSLYRAVSQREGDRNAELIDERKTNKQTTPPAPTASTAGPCPTII